MGQNNINVRALELYMMTDIRSMVKPAYVAASMDVSLLIPS